MGGVLDWSTTPGSNTTVDGVSIAEGMQAGLVNNAMRAIMALVREWQLDASGVVTAGAGDAYTITSNQGIAAYADGLRFSFRADRNNTGAATLNVDGRGAKALRKTAAGALTALASDDIVAEAVYDVVYDASSDVFVIVGTHGVAGLTAFGQLLISAADAAAGRTTLELGALALQANVTTAQIAAATLVTASETLAAHDNDTTIPTSAAVRADRKFTWATVGNLLIGSTQDVSIPAGVTEIVVNVPIGVSLDGTDDFIVRLGDSGGIKSTGYFGQSVLSATSTVSLSTDFRVPLGLASRAWAGHMRLYLDAALTWRWSFFGSVTGSLIASGAGEIGLASELTTLRFTRSGTNNFDAGTSLRVGYR